MLEIERTLQLDASPETVYQWLTKPEHMQKWFADSVTKTADGLSFKWHMQEGGEVGFDVVIVKDEAPSRFMYQATDGSEISTRFDVASDGERTILVLVESGFSDDEAGKTLMEEHAGGWDWFFSRLQSLDT